MLCAFATNSLLAGSRRVSWAEANFTKANNATANKKASKNDLLIMVSPQLMCSELHHDIGCRSGKAAKRGKPRRVTAFRNPERSEGSLLPRETGGLKNRSTSSGKFSPDTVLSRYGSLALLGISEKAWCAR